MRRSVPAAAAPSVPVRSRIGIRAVSPALCEAMPVTPRTLASRIARRESAEFVGRARELLVAETLFGRRGRAACCSSTAPAGSARACCCARSAGAGAGRLDAVRVDARDLAPVPDAVEDALAGAWTAERPLVLIDTYERMSALGGYLRATLLAVAPRARGRRRRRPRRARARLVRGRLGDGGARVAARAALRAGIARAARAPGLGDDAARARRSRAGPAGCRSRCGSARPPRGPTRLDAGAGRGAAARAPAARGRGRAAGPFADVFALACVARVGDARAGGRRAAGRRRRRRRCAGSRAARSPMRAPAA